MQIDWITVLAQLVNFALLIWLLQKLLYTPILSLIAKREAEIKTRIDAAEAKALSADKDREQLAAEHAALSASREQVLAEAVKAGEAESKALLDRALETANKARAVWQKDMQAQSERQSQELARDAVRQLEQIASRCLRDLANEDLQHAMAQNLIDTLTHDPSEKEKKVIEKSLRQGPVSVTSHKTLSAQTKKFLAAELRKTADGDISIDFETDEALGPGLVIKADNQTFAWTIASYLADFMRHVRTIMDGDSEEEPPRFSEVTAP